MSESNQTFRVTLGAAMALIIIGGITDLVLDQPAAWLSFHVLFELMLIAGALTLTTALMIGWWQARRSVSELRRTVEARKIERDAWKASAERALAGFSAAIDAQLVSWGLTPSEREVALLLLKGYSHKRIARETDRSERTVRQHAAIVYQKAGLASRAELAAFFLEDLMVPKGDAS